MRGVHARECNGRGKRRNLHRNIAHPSSQPESASMEQHLRGCRAHGPNTQHHALPALPARHPNVWQAALLNVAGAGVGRRRRARAGHASASGPSEWGACGPPLNPPCPATQCGARGTARCATTAPLQPPTRCRSTHGSRYGGITGGCIRSSRLGLIRWHVTGCNAMAAACLVFAYLGWVL